MNINKIHWSGIGFVLVVIGIGLLGPVGTTISSYYLHRTLPTIHNNDILESVEKDLNVKPKDSNNLDLKRMGVNKSLVNNELNLLTKNANNTSTMRTWLKSRPTNSKFIKLGWNTGRVDIDKLNYADTIDGLKLVENDYNYDINEFFEMKIFT